MSIVQTGLWRTQRGGAMAIKTTEGWVPNEVTARIGARVRWEDVVSDIDWDQAIARLSPPPMPDYVRSSIHGLEGGYSKPGAAATWDPVVKEIFAEYFENETEQRDLLSAQVDSVPSRILDVACGTGESTLAWRRRFPRAQITAIDVSPYMLAVAERKLADDRLIDVRCLNAERLPLEDASYDLVTASLLFHELPEDVAPKVLREMRRVCRPGGEVVSARALARSSRSTLRGNRRRGSLRLPSPLASAGPACRRAGY